jgi:single-strand DNA-binding protein
MAQLFGLARLGRDSELRYTADNTPVSNLSLAFSYGRRAEDGKRPTQWVEGVLWGALAEAISQYLVKGTAVAVTLDDVHIETFQGRDGTPGHKLVGKVTQIELAGSPQRSEAPAQQTRQAAPPTRQQAAPQRQAPARQQSQSTGTGFDAMDDDIPF